MKQSELVKLSDTELKKLLSETRMNMTKMTLNHAVANLEQPHKLRETRRSIARMLTEVKSRKTQNA